MRISNVHAINNIFEVLLECEEDEEDSIVQFALNCDIIDIYYDLFKCIIDLDSEFKEEKLKVLNQCLAVITELGSHPFSYM